MSDGGREALHAIMEDLRGHLVAWLVSRGFDVPPRDQASVSNALDACLRVLHRSISPRPRHVHRSNVLKARQLVGELQERISRVESEITRGEDLNHRLTRRYFNAGFDDRLLNDLGVSHFHLGAAGQGTDTTGQRAMSGAGADLLWVIIKPLDAYLIDVFDHSAFEDYDFVKVIYENWKHLLGEPLPGVSDVEPKLSPKERAGIRRAGFTTLVEHNGEVFHPGGYVSSGLSMAVRRASDDRLNDLVELHRWLRANVEAVRAKLLETTGTPATDLTFRVGNVDALVSGRVNLLEQATGGLFYLDGQTVRCRVPPAANPSAQRIDVEVPRTSG